MHIRSALVAHLRKIFIWSLILRSEPREKEGLTMSHRDLEVGTSGSVTRLCHQRLAPELQPGQRCRLDTPATRP